MENGILQRHKEERKEFQAKIMNMKHGVPKGDKKRKKEVMELIAKLEAELDQKQEQELSTSQSSIEDQLVNEVSEQVNNLSTLDGVENIKEKEHMPTAKLSKAQKRRDKKTEKERERDQRIAEQEEANLLGVRNVEAEKIKAILKERGMVIYEIPSNGDCLYAAIGHQLTVQDKPTTTENLRCQTAVFMRDHKEDFLPFLSDNDGEIFTQEKYDSYCSDIEVTSAWGGQLELRAMSQVTQHPIEVIQSEGPKIIVGEELKKQPLILTYHRHAYGLGEHYNSVVVATESPEEEEFS